MDKKKRLFVIIGVVVIVLIILFIILFNKDGENNNEKPIFGGNIDNVVEEDIKKDNEKGIVLTNLNSYFVKDAGKKTDAFKYEFSLNGERETLKFENVVLNNSANPAKMTFTMNDKEINVMKIINEATLQSPTSIIPNFYILGDKTDEVLVLEVTTIDEDTPSIIYMAINNEGEVRNSFGGFDNNEVTDAEFLKAIKEGTLIYDHKITLTDNDTYCECGEMKKDNWLNKVIAEKKVFSVLEASLKLETDSLYECNAYCK